MTYQMVGFVIRKWAKGAFARVTINPEGGHPKAQLNFRSFGKDGYVEAIDKLQVGQRIQIEFEIESELLKDKSNQEVKIDGYNKWCEVLTARKVRVDAAYKVPEAKAAPVNDLPPDDEIPF